MAFTFKNFVAGTGQQFRAQTISIEISAAMGHEGLSPAKLHTEAL
jgi:hypothetical protein